MPHTPMHRPVSSALSTGPGVTHGLDTIAYGCIVAAAVAAFVYFGRDILVPLSLASLLSFSLWPLIRIQRKIGVGRTTSVLLAVLFAIFALISVGAVLAMQMTELAGELPRYESNLREKVRSLKGASMPSSAIEQAADTIQSLQEELKKGTPEQVLAAGVADPAPLISDTARTSGQPPAGTPVNPVVVELQEPPPSVLQNFQDLVKPLLSPLTTTALVILFLVFILMQREDLRDRILRIAGSSDLQRSTMAMNDAAERLSRFFVIQLALNAGFGIVIGVGLAIIGVPSPIVWGILAALMRFVPYVGSLVAAIFPIALAAAVDPSWSMVIWTVALFAIAEPVAGHVIEPMLYGQSTGLSPVAVVVSALFWTLMWGPVGLLLSTPLTVCLVVLGKHVPALEFLDVVLGDQPALAPEQRLYQRMLAGDGADAAALAEESLEEVGLTLYYDSVAMTALTLAQHDVVRGRLGHEAQTDMLEAIREMAEELDTSELAPPEEAGSEDGDQTTPNSAASSSAKSPLAIPNLAGITIGCLSTRSPLDESAAQLFAHLLRKHGAKTDVISRASAVQVFDSEKQHPYSVVCISHFGLDSPFQVRTLIRRLKVSAPDIAVVAGFWMLRDDRDKVLAWQKITGADYATSSLSEAVELSIAAAGRGASHIAPEEQVTRALAVPRAASS